MGVNYEHLKQISTATGVHVVASGGYYWQNTYPTEVSSMSEDQLAESLVKEAAAGRYGAYGEIADMPGEADFTADERKVYRAVGKAHVRNSLPIFTHNAYASKANPPVPRDAALRQVDLLEGAGVNLQHLAIGHVCCLDDPTAEVARQVAKRGAYVGFDRVTLEFLPDAKPEELQPAESEDRYYGVFHGTILNGAEDNQSVFVKALKTPKGGKPETIHCGAGNDIAKVDHADTVSKDCEQVVRIG